jgi:uncharacterized protein YdeI (YjbR/CyaY-like superfamily)
MLTALSCLGILGSLKWCFTLIWSHLPRRESMRRRDMITPMKVTPKANEYPVLPVDTEKAWSQWLKRNHALSEGVWLRFFRKDSSWQDLTYEQALQEALCYGWIDGQAKSVDSDSWLQKFTPRRPKSVWSKRNRDRVARLITEGRMKPAGLKVIQAAKDDGRWDKAYDSPAQMKVPSDFLAALKKNQEAYRFYKTLNRANTYAIAWRLQTAKKPETRARRLAALLAMLARGEKLH